MRLAMRLMWKGLVALPLHCVWPWPQPQPPLQPGHCSVLPVLTPVCVCTWMYVYACVCLCVCMCKSGCVI